MAAGSRIIKESGPPSMMRQHLESAGADLQLPAEGMERGSMCMATATFHSLAKPGGEV